jgi:hypothetical protein
LPQIYISLLWCTYTEVFTWYTHHIITLVWLAHARSNTSSTSIRRITIKSQLMTNDSSYSVSNRSIITDVTPSRTTSSRVYFNYAWSVSLNGRIKVVPHKAKWSPPYTYMNECIIDTDGSRCTCIITTLYLGHWRRKPELK